MEMLQFREKEIFNTLNEIKEFDFVIIGGYAVNAYALPRYSVDCDIVVKDRKELNKIFSALEKIGYVKINIEHDSYYGKFFRYEKEIANGFKVSMDILFEEVIDRQTGARFDADWIFENSSFGILRGKTIIEKIDVRIIKCNALFAMKFLSCRITDIRDIFMLVVSINDFSWIKKEISERYDFNNRFLKIKERVNSKKFKDDLQGVYGFIDEKIFEKHKRMILEL